MKSNNSRCSHVLTNKVCVLAALIMKQSPWTWTLGNLRSALFLMTCYYKLHYIFRTKSRPWGWYFFNLTVLQAQKVFENKKSTTFKTSSGELVKILWIQGVVWFWGIWQFRNKTARNANMNSLKSWGGVINWKDSTLFLKKLIQSICFQ